MADTNSITYVPKPNAYQFIDHEGETFGRLTVLGYLGRRGRSSIWHCQCECGNTCRVAHSELYAGHTRSCGCLFKETLMERNSTIGGASAGPHRSTYLCFASARGRCRSPKNAAYSYYGGRGIQFKFDSFEDFIAEVGPRPSLEYSIDRIDVEGHYEPGNVRWATKKEQLNNTRRTVRRTHKGITKTTSEWAEESGINRDTLDQRIRDGYCDDCLFVPAPHSCKHR